jgi:23S rRNA U2552 (ribose-2'-O)-methylase RlmE/FtsJ
MTYYDLPIKTKYENFYDQKIIKIKQKTYAVVNFLSYKFITYDDIILEFDDDLPIKTYDDLHNISMNLNKIKRAIDTRYYKKWQYITHQLDAYDKLGEYLSSNYKITNSDQKVSNAFSKMYEMLTTYQLVPKTADNFKSFHFCEAPGMFIIALNHYIQTKTNILNWQWYGNSLCQTTEKTALTDMHGLIKTNTNKWLIGPAKSGDIRDLSNIHFFKSKLSEVDFISSDCGIAVNFSDANTYEELIAETDFAQFINVLNLLKTGGSAIIKTFIPLELASNVCLIYTLSKLFKSVHLSKPITSRPANSEVYIILVEYLGIDQNLLNKLKNLLNNFDPTVAWIKNIPDSFIAQLTDYVHDLAKQQMTYLLNIFHHVDLDINFQSDPNIKKQTNEYWTDKFKFQSNEKIKLI